VLLLVLLPGLTGLVAQQPANYPGTLSLGRAFAIADSQAYTNRLAIAARELRTSERDQTLKGLLPSLRVEGGWTRTNDPLNAFGFALRQRAVTQESFDPARLNFPDPISNIGAGVVAELPLINPDVWLGRGAAGAAVDAADAMVRWNQASARLDVVRAYFGGVLAREQVGAYEAGWTASQSHVRLARSLQTQGLVTRSDVLLAEVKAGEIEAALLAARGQAALAGRQLALALGVSDSIVAQLPEALPEVSSLSRLDSTPEPALRADVAAAQAGAEAARRDVDRATSLLLPRINSFGRLDWNQPDRIGGHPSWTVGVMASWSFFGGGSELVARRAAEARAVTAATEAEAAHARAALELASRRNDLEVARATALIAARAVEQATEAHRIVTRKYEGGLATVTELLESAAVATGTRVERAAAVYRVIVAAAEWRVASGGDGSDLVVLDQR
jgi:outer membrane protein TolC